MRARSKSHSSFFQTSDSITTLLAVAAIGLVGVVLYSVLVAVPFSTTGNPIGGSVGGPRGAAQITPVVDSIVVASAPFASGAPSGLADTGRIAAFDGSGTQRWEQWGSVAYQYLGWSIRMDGSVNGDGIPEVIAGSPYLPQTHGRVDLFSGKDGTPLCNASAPPSMLNSFFGGSVSGSGNLDGDAIPDYVVGAPLHDSVTTGSNDGRAYGISGANCSVILTQAGIGADDHFGKTVFAHSSIFLDGDTLNDYFVGAVLFNQPYSRIGTLYAMSSASAAPLWSKDGMPGGSYFTQSLAVLPDVDGDGIVDVIAGAPGSIVLGTSGISSPGYIQVVSGASGATLLQLDGEFSGDLFGMSVAYLGDNDHDGKIEFAVGAPDYSTPTKLFTGKIYVFELNTPSSASLLWSHEGEFASDYFGFSIAGVKDADFDGQHELVVGAPHFDGAAGLNAGKIYDFGARTGALVWNEEGPATGGGPNQGYRFGYSVSGTPIN